MPQTNLLKVCAKKAKINPYISNLTFLCCCGRCFILALLRLSTFSATLEPTIKHRKNTKRNNIKNESPRIATRRVAIPRYVVYSFVLLPCDFRRLSVQLTRLPAVIAGVENRIEANLLLSTFYSSLL